MFPLYEKRYQFSLRHRYDHDRIPDPFELRYLDPDNVTKRSPFAGSDYGNDLGTIEDGDWDRAAVPLESYDLYTSIIERFTEGTPWEETAYYRRVRNEVRGGAYKFGCATVDDVDERFEDLDALYESIDTIGYRSARKLDDEDDPLRDGVRPIVPSVINEVIVDVARDGEPLLVEGRHRLAIATALGLDEIPVLVARRHAEWQERRDSIEPSDQSPDRGHFDLADLGKASAVSETATDS